MNDVNAPHGAKDARQAGVVARAVLALAVAVGLMGCEVQSQTQTPQNLPSWVNAIVDPDTGCQYLNIGDRGITPRLGRDGKPMCGAP